MEWSFRQLGQALPPWRETAATLSKWRAQPQPDVPASEALPPGSPPAPCRCCCDTAADARTAAAACGGRQPRSPCSVLGTASSGGFEAAAQAAVEAALTDRRACSTPTSPMACGGGAGQAAVRRMSLLSRSLESMRREAALTAQRQPAADPSWWQPRTVVVVRRST